MVRRSVWVFLARRRFAAKTPAIEGWIHVDFLGFSRANRDFSMGYTDKTVKNFSSRFSRGVGKMDPKAQVFVLWKGGDSSSGKLTLASDFLQAIVAPSEIIVRAVRFRPPQSKSNLL